jgi:hypothetical protein
MSEKFRFRLLCWLARRLGFDLSEVTPEELKKPKPPEPLEPADWYVWKKRGVEGWRVTDDDSHANIESIVGPLCWEDAERLMLERNNLWKELKKEKV